LPLVEDHAGLTFSQALRTNLIWQKHLALDLRRFVWLPAVYALVPALIIGIKWSGNFGDASPIGNVFAKSAAVLLHAGLLALLVYVAFDPPVSPRESAARAVEEFGVRFVFLPCYFLAALAIGYFTGFLLLLFSGTETRTRRRSATPPALNYAVTGMICIGALVAVGMLLHENFPFIRQEQSRSLLTDAQTQAKSLPEDAVVMSDDAVRLHALAAVLGRAATQKYILIESRGLSDPRYHRFLRKRYGSRVPEMILPKGYTTFGPPPILQFLGELNQKHELAYLHPSFGYFFESFYLEPRDAVYTLRRYTEAMALAPPASPELIARQQDFWKSLESGLLKELKAEIAGTSRGRNAQDRVTSTYVANHYSRALDDWGVALQRADRFDEALAKFEEALALNPDNAAALINRDFNVTWRKEHKGLPSMSREQQAKLNLYQGVDALMLACGPIDEPSFSREFGNYFMALNLYRQAEQMLLRGLAYNKGDESLQIALANVYLASGQPQRAASLVASMAAPRPDNHADLAERARVRGWAKYLEDDFSGAQKILEEATRDYPELDAPFAALTKLYLAYADKLRADKKGVEANIQLTNALHVIERQVGLQPVNASAHFNHGNCCIFVGDYDCAIKAFTQVLELQKENGAALLNRAIAYYRAGDAAAAKRDYQDVLRRFTTTNYQVYYGLAEIAYAEKDWSAAREYYEKYLRYAPESLTEERNRMRQRLEEVKKK
jgi:tetratricopeptide (TPR) repeat protein